MSDQVDKQAVTRTKKPRKTQEEKDRDKLAERVKEVEQTGEEASRAANFALCRKERIELQPLTQSDQKHDDYWAESKRLKWLEACDRLEYTMTRQRLTSLESSGVTYELVLAWGAHGYYRKLTIRPTDGSAPVVIPATFRPQKAKEQN